MFSPFRCTVCRMYTILTNTRVHPEQTAPAHALVEVLRIGALAGAGGAQHGAQYANHCGAAPTGPAGALLGHAVHCTGLLVVLQLESVAIKKRSHYVNTCSLSLSLSLPARGCLPETVSLVAVIVIVVALVSLSVCPAACLLSVSKCLVTCSHLSWLESEIDALQFVLELLVLFDCILWYCRCFFHLKMAAKFTAAG